MNLNKSHTSVKCNENFPLQMTTLEKFIIQTATNNRNYRTSILNSSNSDIMKMRHLHKPSKISATIWVIYAEEQRPSAIPRAKASITLDCHGKQHFIQYRTFSWTWNVCFHPTVHSFNWKLKHRLRCGLQGDHIQPQNMQMQSKNNDFKTSDYTITLQHFHHSHRWTCCLITTIDHKSNKTITPFRCV